MIITPNQTLGTCAEDADVSDAICDPKIAGECANKTFNLGHGEPIDHIIISSISKLTSLGVSTGRCIQSQRKGVFTCEIEGWCPIEKDDYPLKNNRPLLTDTKYFTVLIKNSIQFREYNVRRRNIIEVANSSDLRNCIFHPDTNPGCPVFVLNDIVTWAEQDYDKISTLGGVIGIEINWDCNLDFDLKYCVPKYLFRRLDDPNTKIAKGWNFRYSNYFPDNSRTLFKATGIRFVLLVNGSAGKFNFIPLVIKVGSGLGLLAIVSLFNCIIVDILIFLLPFQTTILCDIVVLYLDKSGHYYKDKKFQYVEQVDDQTVSKIFGFPFNLILIRVL